MIRVLVVGADNFVGRRLVEALKASDWAEPVIAGPIGVGSFVGVKAVVNCTVGEPKAILSTARALYRTLDAREGAPLRIVHLGSMTIYGAARGQVDEHAGPEGALGPYAAVQYAAEQLARSVGAVVLRAGVEYGPGAPAWGERVGRWLLADRIGDLGADGEGVCNLVLVDDLVAALIAALRVPGIEAQAFNIAQRDAPSWNGYFAAYAAALGRPLKAIPAWRLAIETLLLAVPLKVLQRLLRALKLGAIRIPEPIPPSLPATCRQTLRLDVQRAEQVLGLRWTPLDIGVKAAAAALDDRVRTGAST